MFIEFDNAREKGGYNEEAEKQSVLEDYGSRFSAVQRILVEYGVMLWLLRHRFKGQNLNFKFYFIN